MKTKLWLSIALFSVLFACNEGSETTTIYTYKNNSGHNIEMQEYYGGKFQRVKFVNNNEELEIDFSLDRVSGDIPILRVQFADSILVVYYEKASIWHTTDEGSHVSKSLMLESSYTGGKVRDGLYEYSYTFTPDDFDEAVLYGE